MAGMNGISKMRDWVMLLFSLAVATTVRGQGEANVTLRAGSIKTSRRSQDGSLPPNDLPRVPRDSRRRSENDSYLSPPQNRSSSYACLCVFDFDETLRVIEGLDKDTPAREGAAAID